MKKTRSVYVAPFIKSFSFCMNAHLLAGSNPDATIEDPEDYAKEESVNDWDDWD